MSQPAEISSRYGHAPENAWASWTRPWSATPATAYSRKAAKSSGPQ